jgi:D-tyrosyl-tRNA(Tyr) deacylase
MNLPFTIHNSQFTIIMKSVIQRVFSASVTVEAKIVAEIQQGLLVLLGIEDADNQEDIDWLCQKIANLRIFSPTPTLPEGEGGKNQVMNLSVKDINGDIIVVSQFTLQASTKKGNRPSYIKASKAEIAIPLYQNFILQLEAALGKKVQSGVFGADMKVALVNDGPVTIVIDTKNRF